MNKPFVGMKRTVNAKVLYIKLLTLLMALNILLKIGTPSKEQLDEMLELLTDLKERLEV